MLVWLGSMIFSSKMISHLPFNFILPEIGFFMDIGALAKEIFTLEHSSKTKSPSSIMQFSKVNPSI